MAMNPIRLAITAVAILMAVFVCVPAEALTVTKFVDTNDGNCDADCSLREAFTQADAVAGADTIDVPAGVFILSLGELSLNSAVKLQGVREVLTLIDGGDASRILSIGASGSVSISGITFQNGNAPFGESGGAILSSGVLTLTRCRLLENSAPVAGGAVRVDAGSLTISNSTVRGNTAFNGGGISSLGPLTITNSTISGNTANFGGGIGSNGNPVIITNTTISGNTASTIDGGGLKISGGSVTLNNVTITGNSANSSNGGISNSASVTVQNTIIAGNTSDLNPDCGGTALNSLGHNLVGDASCVLTGDLTGNITGVNPKLAPLGSNGGRTFTHALLASSPAIDAGNNSTCAATDQRSVSRQNAGCDIGAFEFSCRVWQRANSPDTNPEEILVDPLSSLTLYAAAGLEGSGILKSTDGGISWNPANTGLTDLFIKSIAVDPTSSSVLYAGGLVSGIFKSTNAGASWELSNTGAVGTPMDIAIDPLNPATIYTSTFAFAVNKSTNGGASWSALTNGIAATVLSVAVDPLFTSTVYATTDNGILISINGGANWAPANNGLAAGVVPVIALDPTKPGRIYAGTSSSGVFLSTDGGGSWSSITGGPTGEIVSLALDPIAGIVYAGTQNQGVFRSNDGGLNWVQQNAGLLGDSIQSQPFFVNALAVRTNGTVLAGVQNGLFSFDAPSLACDDFEDGDADDWTFTKGNWAVVSGELNGTFFKKADNISPFPACSTCVMEGYITIESPLGRASLLGWYSNKLNLVEVALMEDKDKILLKQKAGGVTVAKGKLIRILNAGETYHLRVEFDGSQFHVAVNGIPGLVVNTGTAPSGGLGVRVKSTTGANATVSFREFIVY